MGLATLSDMRVLVVNSGSSSVKLRLLDPSNEAVFARDVSVAGDRLDGEALAQAVAEPNEVEAAGHRIVHGGHTFRESVLVDEQITSELESLTDLAPLHQARALAALETVTRALPAVPSVACFDTAFHAHLPDAAAVYPLPAQWREGYRIKRFGFHGLSHSYVTRRAAEVVGRPQRELRIVSCHLGAGASLAAVQHGASVDTTMGFTPLEGLVMATRSGSIDPGLLLWLQEHKGLSATEVSTGLEHDSGLKGIAGTPDMKAIVAAAAAGDTAARLALDVYIHRLRAGIAAMATSMGGLDLLVFTGGVGERSPVVRRLATERLGFLGVSLDPELNEMTAEGDISAEGATVRTLVVTSREDIEIAGEVRRVVGLETRTY